MKKTTLLFGSLLAVFLMIMIPNVSAIEYDQVQNLFEERTTNQLFTLSKNFSNTNFHLQNLPDRYRNSSAITSFLREVNCQKDKKFQDLKPPCFNINQINKSVQLRFFSNSFSPDTIPLKVCVSDTYGDDYNFWEVLTAFLGWMVDKFGEDFTILIMILSLCLLGIPLLIFYFWFLMNNPEYIGEIINDIGRVFSFIRNFFSKICDILQTLYEIFEPIIEPIIATILLILKWLLEDSDGPTEGGLDDIYDWIYLIFFVYILFHPDENNGSINLKDLWNEAFDRQDIDGDGM